MSRVAMVVRKPSLRRAYRRGRALEYVVKADLERRGGFVMRSAGSHSPADLLWLSRDFISPRAVQCKLEGAELGPKARREYSVWCHRYGLVALLATKVRGGFRIERVLEDGALVELS